jgi:hypothetical protein
MVLFITLSQEDVRAIELLLPLVKPLLLLRGRLAPTVGRFTPAGAGLNCSWMYFGLYGESRISLP